MGGTPLDDAYVRGNKAVISLLQESGAKRGENRLALESLEKKIEGSDGGIDEPIWAASRGSLDALERLVARGQRIDVADYDLRTPLHLAASEGHVEVVRYLLNQGHVLEPLDRWGNTPLDDAIRHGHESVQSLLEQATVHKKEG